MTTLTQTTPGTLTGTWNVDAVHSALDFSVKHMLVATFRGSFNDFGGTLTADENGVGIQASARVASVQTHDASLYGHLQAPDFFDAERHPELQFRASAIEQIDSEVTIPGELTIKGTSRPVELRGSLTGPVTDPYGNERIGLDLTAIIDRTDFGLSWNAPLPGGGFVLSNQVTISAHLSLVKNG